MFSINSKSKEFPLNKILLLLLSLLIGGNNYLVKQAKGEQFGEINFNERDNNNNNNQYFGFINDDSYGQHYSLPKSLANALTPNWLIDVVSQDERGTVLVSPEDENQNQNNDDDGENFEILMNTERLQQQQQQPEGRIQARSMAPEEERNKYSYDNSLASAQHNSNSPINVHLPTTNLFGQEGTGLSPPVNEPLMSENEEEEENNAELGYLTSKLNSEYPNSLNRTRLILQLIDGIKERGDENEQNGLAYLKIDENLKRFMRYLYELQSESTSTPDESSDERQQQQQHSSTTLPSARYGASEYIEHPLALSGHQYVQGGAGEGRQLLGPEGTFENVQVIKSDSAVPSYCDPPNPCPLGYTAKDGCLEKFVNSASFSREYQAKQQCSCDNEHSLFNCASAPLNNNNKNNPTNDDNDNVYSTTKIGANNNNDDGKELNHIDEDFQFNGNKLDTLARSLQNRFGDLASIKQLIERHEREMNDDNLLVRSARKWSQPLNSLASEHESKMSILD